MHLNHLKQLIIMTLNWLLSIFIYNDLNLYLKQSLGNQLLNRIQLSQFLNERGTAPWLAIQNVPHVSENHYIGCLAELGGVPFGCWCCFAF